MVLSYTVLPAAVVSETDTPFAEFDSGQIDFGIGLNTFMEESSEIIARFSDSRRHRRVLCVVREELLATKGVNLNHHAHPFNLYTTVNKTENSALRALSQAICEMFQERRERDAVVSLFHSSGAYRDELMELLDSYWEYMDTCLGLDDSDSDGSSESGSSENGSDSDGSSGSGSGEDEGAPPNA